jgi:RNA polymerase sigma-70 factor (ECF subfamily)
LDQKNYTDQDLILECRKGKSRFQEMLYRRFYAFAMSVCLRYAPNRDDALEILNDSFMKVFQNIMSYNTEKPFKSWFRKILVNTSLDKYKENKKYSVHVEFDVGELEIASEPDLEKQLNAEEILELLSGLPQIYRLVFNLYEIEGYSHDEIAGMLDIAPGTSRSQLSRAKLLLKKNYSEMKNKPYHEAI